MYVRFIHVVVHSSCSFSFIIYSIPYVDVPPFSIYSTFDGHSQCCSLVLLWITLIGTFLCVTLLNLFMNCCGTIPRSAWQGRSKDMSRFSICRYYQLPNLHFQLQCVCSPPPPTTLLPHSCCREVVVHWDLICISQMRLKNFHMLNDHLVEVPQSWLFPCVSPQLLGTVASKGCTWDWLSSEDWPWATGVCLFSLLVVFL